MSWLIIDAKTHEIVSGAHGEKPATTAATYPALIMFGWPKTVIWSPAARGFVRRSVVQALIDPSPRLQAWNGPTTADEFALLKAEVVTELKDQAENLKMNSLTPGGAKKEEYAGNKAEVRDADQLGGALLTLISTLRLQGVQALEARFPQAAANAAEFGDTIPDALNRFRGGIARSAPCPKISAREARVCADIRAAKDAAALAAILAKHKWPTA